MLEEYFVKPETIDRVRGSWIGPQVESYVEWMAERGYRARNVQARVPVLIGFGEFARGRGARTVEELPAHIDAFVAQRVAERGRARPERAETDAGKGGPGPDRADAVDRAPWLRGRWTAPL